MKMLLGLSEALPHLVEAKFRSAKAAQSLIFSHTELTLIRASEGVPFQLRYCPALASKPDPKKDEGRNSAPPAKKPDPFDEPPHDLLIAHIPSTNPSHLLVLNKFPVIPEHFILATRANKQQTHALEQDDLEATYACLQAWQSGEAHGNKRLFAFFNSGEHSGASQPHRHLQFLPVERMKANDTPDGWDPLIDLLSDTQSVVSKDTSSRLLQHPAIPFTHYALSFPSAPSGAQLHDAYNSLYEAAKEAVVDYIAAKSDDLTLHATEGGSLPISYNLAMTTTSMAICPRRSGGFMLQRDDGTDIGHVEVNGTVLGGTLMVSNSELWDILQSEPERLRAILKAIGIPRDTRPQAV
ncbi:Ap4A phosphorylase-like protein II [Lojkania enalia]|uniref:Ap4A phosphorylase-like protein II n=1 Tax=Lojkania enalia TaxID=147567 RepID=A0A9P4TRS0_9PLEO|nr:Ap4A phosphorylase-like protein II [Didymosphaeria enalia]